MQVVCGRGRQSGVGLRPCSCAAEGSCSLWRMSFGCTVPQHHPGVTELEQRDETAWATWTVLLQALTSCAASHCLSEPEKLVGEQPTPLHEE